MSNWAYVAIAYTVVWGSLAVYAVFLARRVAQARKAVQRLRDEPVVGSSTEPEGQEPVAAGQRSGVVDSGLKTAD